MRTWIRGYCACIIAVGPLLLAGTFEARAAAGGLAYEARGDSARAEADLAAAKQLGE
jgi:hypothetical protein